MNHCDVLVLCDVMNHCESAPGDSEAIYPVQLLEIVIKKASLIAPWRGVPMYTYEDPKGRWLLIT